MKLQVEQEDAIRVIAHYHDFNGDLPEWKNSFYEIWRYQMTFNFAYSITVKESRKNGVYVDLLIRPSFKKNVLDMMDVLRFENVNTYADKIGVICDYETEYSFTEAVTE